MINNSERNKLNRDRNMEIAVGDGVTVCLYSDQHACTVIKRTKTTMIVQRDKATLSGDFRPEFEIGGFLAHCTNNSQQEYTYEADPNGQIYKCYWSEKYGRWQTGNGTIEVIPGRHEFYDYNF